MSENAGPEFWDEGAVQAQDVADWIRGRIRVGRTVVAAPGETPADAQRRFAAGAERRRRIAAAMRGGPR